MTPDLNSIYERLAGPPQLSLEDEAALFSVSVHETAHSLVAERLGLDSDTLVVSANAGVCVSRQGSTLANAAVSWGGVIGECLLNAPHKDRTLPKTKLSLSTLPHWIGGIRWNELSREDREGIEGHHSKYESAKLAFEILNENLELLEVLAKSLADRSREKFAANRGRPTIVDEMELETWVRGCEEKSQAERAAQNLQQAMADAEQILASLPPVPVPKEFNLQSFVDATGATDFEIRAFCAYRVQRERWQIGLGAPSPEAVETAVNFFKQSAVHTRESWIHAARQFCEWRSAKEKLNL